MPRGGTLTVETAGVVLDERFAGEQPNLVPGPYVMLRITDTGAGMDAATQARAFEPFFTTKEHGKGKGLGLPAVLGIVQQSRGSIWLTSEPGKGTAVTVCLPVAVEATPTVADVAPASRTGREAILLVEEDDGVRDALGATLRRTGYDVIEASNGGEALLLFEERGGRVDLLLAEVLLPRLGGRQLAARLKATQPALRVLFMSRYAHAPRGKERVAAPGEILRKPISPATLVAKVREALDTTA
jgi:CheY-like chemotaxis protein